MRNRIALKKNKEQGVKWEEKKKDDGGELKKGGKKAWKSAHGERKRG